MKILKLLINFKKIIGIISSLKAIADNLDIVSKTLKPEKEQNKTTIEKVENGVETIEKVVSGVETIKGGISLVSDIIGIFKKDSKPQSSNPLLNLSKEIETFNSKYL